MQSPIGHRFRRPSLPGRAPEAGTEAEFRLEFLEGLGCEYGQGFFFAQPLEIEVFEKYVRESVARAEQRAASAKPSPVA